jgi:hypothetical protein
VDCGVNSPTTNSNYSLIGLAGWRLSPANPNEWRCPACWTAFKQRNRAQTTRMYPKLEQLRRR